MLTIVLLFCSLFLVCYEIFKNGDLEDLRSKIFFGILIVFFFLIVFDICDELVQILRYTW